jgi:hypothetical protein
MLFGFLPPTDFGYSVYTVWYSCSHDFGYPVYAVWYFSPKDFGYSVYTVWYSFSQRCWLSCLCCLVFLLPTILAILFMLFGILAPNDFGYSINRIAKNVGSKNTKQHKKDSQNRWEQEYQTA